MPFNRKQLLKIVNQFDFSEIKKKKKRALEKLLVIIHNRGTLKNQNKIQGT